MNDISFEEIKKLDCESRYEMFLSMVAEQRDVWILVNEKMDFLTIHSKEHDIEYVPIWPHQDFTEHHSKNSSQKLYPKSITAPEFFAKWVVGLEGDNLKVGVFPNAKKEVWIMEPSELKSDLQDEFNQ